MSDRRPFEIAVWHGPETEDGDAGHAVQTLRDRFAPQVDWPVAVRRESRVDLPGAPYDSYERYLETFRENVDLQTGVVNVCLYRHRFYDEILEEFVEEAFEFIDENTILSCAPTGTDETTGTDAFPYAGYARGHLAPDTAPHVVVNAAMRVPLYPDPLFENFLVHEALHPVLTDGEAPDGDDHSYGTVEDGAATPMLTGYVESIAQNEPPTAACDLATVPTTNRHTTTLSRCTRSEVERYLGEQFDGDE